MPSEKKVLTDKEANAAEMGYRFKGGEEDFEIPPAIRQSAGEKAPSLRETVWGYPVVRHVSPRAAYGQRQLKRGNSVQYTNEVEKNDKVDSNIPRDQRSTAFIAPGHIAKSWEEDVLNEPTAAPAAQRFAQQRIDQATA